MSIIAEKFMRDHRDSISAYRSCLGTIVEDSLGIDTFKSGAYPSLHIIYEHAPPAESKAGLQFVIKRASHILDNIDSLTINDKYGSPASSSYALKLSQTMNAEYKHHQSTEVKREVNFNLSRPFFTQ